MVRKVINMSRRRRNRRGRAGAVVVSIVVLLFCAVVFYSKTELDAKSVKIREEEKLLEKQKAELEDKDSEVEAYEEYVHSKEYIEYLARTKFGLVYPDEIIFEVEE